jgi:hypothetical protein
LIQRVAGSKDKAEPILDAVRFSPFFLSRSGEAKTVPHCRREKLTPRYTFACSASSVVTTPSSSFSSSWAISSLVRPSLDDFQPCTTLTLTLRPCQNRSRRAHLALLLRLRIPLPRSPQVRLPPPSSLSPSRIPLNLRYRLLDSQDDFVRLKSSVVASVLLSNDPSPADEVVQKLLFHLGTIIRPSFPSSASGSTR